MALKGFMCEKKKKKHLSFTATATDHGIWH